MTDRIKAEQMAARLVGLDEMSSPTKIKDTFEEETGITFDSFCALLGKFEEADISINM